MKHNLKYAIISIIMLLLASCGSKKKIVDKVEVKEEKSSYLTKTDSIAMINWFKNYLSELDIEPINEADSTHVIIETPQGNFKVTSKNAKVNISSKQEEGVTKTVQEIKTDSIVDEKKKPNKLVRTSKKTILRALCGLS